MKKGIPIILAIIFSTMSYATSFDCQKAQSKVEKMICANEGLSKVDELLGLVYKKELDNLPKENKQKYASEQLAWLKGSRDKCEDVICLKQIYWGRVLALLDPEYSKFYEQPNMHLSADPVEEECSKPHWNDKEECFNSVAYSLENKIQKSVDKYVDELRSEQKNEEGIWVGHRKAMSDAILKSQKVWIEYEKIVCHEIIELEHLGGTGSTAPDENRCKAYLEVERLSKLPITVGD